MTNPVDPELKQAIAMAHAGDVDQARSLAEQIVENDPENENALYLLSALADNDDDRQAYLNQVLLVNPSHEGAMRYSDELASAALLKDRPAEEEIEASEDFFDLDATDEFDFEAETAAAEEEAEEPDTEFDEEALLVAAAVQAADYGLEGEDFDEQSEAVEVPSWLEDEGGYYEQMPPEEEEDLDELAEAVAWMDEAEEDSELVDQEELIADETLEGIDELDPVAAEAAVDELVDDFEISEEEQAAADKAAKPKRKGPSDRTLTIVLIVLAVIAVAIVAGIAYILLTQIN